MESQLGTLSGLEGMSQVPLFCNKRVGAGRARGGPLAGRDRAEKALWSQGVRAVTRQEARGLGCPSHLEFLQLLPSPGRESCKAKGTWEEELAELFGGTQLSRPPGAHRVLSFLTRDGLLPVHRGGQEEALRLEPRLRAPALSGRGPEDSAASGL